MSSSDLDLNSKKILLIDDDDICRHIMRYILEDLGIGSDIAGSAKEALDILKTNQYQLIFADIGMPEINGIEFARRARQDLHIKTPIVVTTGHVTKKDHDAYQQEGIEYILEKPIRPNDVKNLLQEQFSQLLSD